MGSMDITILLTEVLILEGFIQKMEFFELCITTSNLIEDVEGDDRMDIYIKLYNEYKGVDITNDIIKDIHKRLYLKEYDIYPGKYRSHYDIPGSCKQVYTYDYNGDVHHYMDGFSVGYEMESFIVSVNNMSTNPLAEYLAYLHFNFLSIHPFIDGNGRVARFITLLLLEKYTSNFIDFYKDKRMYFKLLNECDKQCSFRPLIPLFELS